MERNSRCPVLTVTLAVGMILLQALTAFAQDQHFLWRVQSEKKSCFILGSIHLMKEEHYPLGRMIENAFEQSAVLVVEINLNTVDPKALQGVMAEAFYPEGDALDKHVSPQVMSLILKKAQTLGLAPDWLKRQKPWFLAVTLPSLALAKAGYDPRYGVDVHFMQAAQGKKILEIESLESQMKTLSGLTATQQESLLLYTLRDLDTAVGEADALVAAWKSGDTRALEAVALKAFKDDPQLQTIAGRVLDERNRLMADKIEQILKTQDDCFVVIGAAHLVGQNSVLRLLKDKGLRVGQL